MIVDGGKCGMCLEVPENEFLKSVLEIMGACSRCWKIYPDRAKKALAESVEETVTRKMAKGWTAEFSEIGECRWIQPRETNALPES